jgi:hypothetical protein
MGFENSEIDLNYTNRVNTDSTNNFQCKCDWNIGVKQKIAGITMDSVYKSHGEVRNLIDWG